MDATSKTAKKNKKRKGKKTSIKLGSSDHDADQVLSILKEELVIAKREKVNWDSDQIIHTSIGTRSNEQNSSHNATSQIIVVLAHKENIFQFN